MRPERRVVSVLQHVAWRTRAADLLNAAASGGAAAALVAFAHALVGGQSSGRWEAAALAGAVVAAVISWRRRRAWSFGAAAKRIERSSPTLRNLLITAHELVVHPDRASAWMRAHVLAQAAQAVEAVEPSRVVPLRRPAALAIGAAVLVLAVSSRVGGEARHVVAAVAERVASMASRVTGRMRVAIAIVPPAYLETQPSRVVDPERVDAVEGSLIRLTISGASPARVRFGAAPLPVRSSAEGDTFELRLRESGYLAIERADGEAPVLLPVTVRPDAAPTVRVERPARDLLAPRASFAFDIAVSAADDFGLDALELRYTKVSGSGEQFEFEEGTLPLRVAADSSRAWQGRARLALARLKMQPGDALVYRAVARDRRPGAGAASSDTYYVEIQGPGQVPLEGVDLPPDQERYALSQQMVVLKIERLRARESSMARDALAEESAAIAAEQRAVRGNFIFLMGGHVEDEEEEAEQSHEIQEGRLENSARREISTAIRHMTRAEQGLAGLDTGAALKAARDAVEALQRAFGRNRYILRTMPIRSRIDPSRRLTGALAGTADWRRDVPDAVPDETTREARALLADLLTLASDAQAGTRFDPRRVSALGERALAIDPASSEWQEAARRLEAAGIAFREQRGDGLARLGEAVAPIAAAAGRHALLPPPVAAAPASRLERAWAERQR